MRAYVLFHALAYGVTPFTSGRSCASVRHTGAFPNSARLVRVSCLECVFRVHALSFPQSDHDLRGDSATGYQQSCSKLAESGSIILTAHTTKEEVRRWDAQERKSTLKRSASLPNWGSPKRTLPSMWGVVKRRSAGVLLRFTNSVSRNPESLSEGSCGSMREQATPR